MGPSLHAACRHGAHARTLCPERSENVHIHEEGAEHLWTWIYQLLAALSMAAQPGLIEANLIALAVFGGSVCGYLPFSGKGRRIRLKNTAYAERKAKEEAKASSAASAAK